MYVCVCVCVYIYMHRHIHALHACMHAYRQTDMHAYTHPHARTHTHTHTHIKIYISTTPSSLRFTASCTWRDVSRGSRAPSAEAIWLSSAGAASMRRAVMLVGTAATQSRESPAPGATSCRSSRAVSPAKSVHKCCGACAVAPSSQTSRSERRLVAPRRTW